MQNLMKTKIHDGEVALGVSLMFPSPQLVDAESVRNQPLLQTI